MPCRYIIPCSSLLGLKSMREKEGAGQCTMSLGAIGSGDVPQLYNRLRFGVAPSFIVKKNQKLIHVPNIFLWLLENFVLPSPKITAIYLNCL